MNSSGTLATLLSGLILTVCWALSAQDLGGRQPPAGKTAASVGAADDVREAGDEYESELHRACSSGEMDRIVALLEEGAAPSIPCG